MWVCWLETLFSGEHGSNGLTAALGILEVFSNLNISVILLNKSTGYSWDSSSVWQKICKTLQVETVKNMFMGFFVMIALNHCYLEPAKHYIDFIEV